jgi:hypothetical protein
MSEYSACCTIYYTVEATLCTVASSLITVSSTDYYVEPFKFHSYFVHCEHTRLRKSAHKVSVLSVKPSITTSSSTSIMMQRLP